MVRYHRFHQLKKGEKVGENGEQLPLVVLLTTNTGSHLKRSKPKLLSLLFLSLLSFCFVLAPLVFSSSFSAFPFLDSSGGENESIDIHVDMKSNSKPPMPSLTSSGSISCDRSGYRSDICFMKGDIRTHSPSSSIFLYTSEKCANGLFNNVSSIIEEDKQKEDGEIQHEKIRPYTRKWETSIMETIHELDIIMKKGNSIVHHHSCDVHHDVPAVFFSTGGYTGNVYHEFNDGILPLYITSQHFNKKVVFVILNYHKWWKMKYADVLSQLSDYPLIDFSGDRSTHCFPEAVVGLKIHGELTMDPSLMQGNETIISFQDLLGRAYLPRVRSLTQEEEEWEAKKRQGQGKEKPKLVLLSRKGSRAITNEDSLVKMAAKIGFKVVVLRPDRTTELAKIYRELSSSKVMVGVHGAAMTHFLFMRPGTVFIQIIPLGTDWAAETYYGEPAKKLGLKYIGYSILPRESSLYKAYDKDDPVLRDPRSITKKGWEYTKKIYLDHQNVKLDLKRFKKQLVDAYAFSITKTTRRSGSSSFTRHQ